MTYDTAFYDLINQGSLSSAEEIVPIIMDLLNPTTVIDVGCGEGAWLSIFGRYGVVPFGIDGPHVDKHRLLIEDHFFHPIDLASEWSLATDLRWDLAISLEVAEHLPESAADTFMAQLCQLANVVLFSAAIPGQGGVGHLNEQWPGYWVEKFNANNFDVTGALRWKVWENPNVENWYRQNLMLAVHRDLPLTTRPRLSELLYGPLAPMWPVVHPILWDSRR